MDCSNCGETNRTGAKFCDECGTPLQRACESCGHELRPTAKFCDECGTPADGSPPSTPQVPPVDEAVRKTVTVLFADLVGSTAFDRTASALAAGDTSGHVVSPDRFLQALEEHGHLAVALLRDLSRQVRGANERIAARNTADTSTRLARKLLDLTHTYGEHDPTSTTVELRVAQDDLAAWIGSTRETVARSLKTWRDNGVVSTGRGRIRVHDAEALEAASIG